MNSRISKIATETLEKNLARMAKYNRMLTLLFIFTILLGIYGLATGSSTSAVTSLIVVSLLKFVIYPKQMNQMKQELERRNGIVK